jgi:hypothetical protein
MENRIRKLSIGKEVKEQFHFILGSKFPVPIDGKMTDKTISHISENENSYDIYLKSGTEIQLWKTLPKNDITSVEFVVD